MNNEGLNKKIDSHVNEEILIAKGELKPQNRQQKQFRLAVEIYEKYRGNKFNLSNHNDRNSVMELWTNRDEDEKTFSGIYREIEEHPDFKTHSKFKGDFNNITIEDIEYYREHQNLPPDLL